MQRIKGYVNFGWQLLDGSRRNHERHLADIRQGDIAPYLEENPPLRVLDLANGYLRPQYVLLKGAGHQVYGIDIANRPQRGWANTAYGVARWFYTRKLGLTASSNGSENLVCGDVAVLPFLDNSFHLVTSIAAFEHFERVVDVVTEIRRILRPGGVAWVCIHLFTSPSGGHNLSLTEIPLRNIPPRIDVWDHLRKRQLPFHVSLNEWRQSQYLEAFARHFEILKDYCAIREGEEFLTPQIRAELSDYSRDELTCGAYVILARKAP